MGGLTRRASQAAAGILLEETSAVSGELTASKLEALKSKRIMFGHQSVGANMVSGISNLYNSYGVTPPTQMDAGLINSTSGGFFADFYVGVNEDPLSKITDFNSMVHTYHNKLDIAFMKFCYIDIVAGTDILQVFTAYKAMMDGLVAEFPDITFIYVTGALDGYSVAAAVVREQLNNMIRNEYASTGRLFDLAEVESTAPNGTRSGGISDGNQYYQSYDDYTSDGAHLNSTGIQVVDEALFNFLAGLI